MTSPRSDTDLGHSVNEQYKVTGPRSDPGHSVSRPYIVTNPRGDPDLEYYLNRLSLDDNVFADTPAGYRKSAPSRFRQTSFSGRDNARTYSPKLSRRTTFGGPEDIGGQWAAPPPVLRRKVLRQESFGSQTDTAGNFQKTSFNGFNTRRKNRLLSQKNSRSSDEDSLPEMSEAPTNMPPVDYHKSLKIESPLTLRRNTKSGLTRSATFDTGPRPSAEERRSWYANKTGVLNKTLPFTGHEHPYSIWMSHLRDERKDSSVEHEDVGSPGEMDINDNSVQCQFILRETKKVHKKISVGE